MVYHPHFHLCLLENDIATQLYDAESDSSFGEGLEELDIITMHKHLLL